MSKTILKLYITGNTERTRRALANIREICDNDLAGHYEIIIVDVLERPQLAEDERILATPTLIRHLPMPLRRIVGDLSDSEKVLLGLDLQPSPNSTKEPIEP